MTPADIIILILAVLVLAIAIAVPIVRKRKGKSSCGASCIGCPHAKNCSGHQEDHHLS